MKITIELDAETYELAKRSGKTHRQIFCAGLGIPYKTKKIGRPSMDEITQSLQAKAEKLREEEGRQALLDRTEATKKRLAAEG